MCAQWHLRNSESGGQHHATRFRANRVTPARISKMRRYKQQLWESLEWRLTPEVTARHPRQGDPPFVWES